MSRFTIESDEVVGYQNPEMKGSQRYICRGTVIEILGQTQNGKAYKIKWINQSGTELERYIPDNTPMKATHKQLGAGKKKSSKKKTTGKKVRKIHKGPRGGKYYISKGKKVYI